MSRKLIWFMVLCADLITGAVTSVFELPKWIPFLLAMAALPLSFMLWRSPRRSVVQRYYGAKPGKILQFPGADQRKRG